MLRKTKLSAAAGLFWFLAVHLLSAPALAQPGLLDTRVESIHSDFARLATATVAVRAIDVATGEVIADFDHQGGPTRIGSGLIPASNQKLLTTGAALHLLPPDFHFTTRLLVNGGELIIEGSGDPAFGDPELLAVSDPPQTADGFLGWLADATRQAGLERPAGIVVDDSIFDNERIHPTWKRNQLNRGYSAEVAGLNFHTNVLVFRIRATGAGRAPSYEISPGVSRANWIEVSNRARSITSGRNTVWIARALNGARYTLSGDVRSADVDVTMFDAPMMTGRIIAQQFAGDGSPPPPVRRVNPNETFESAEVAAIVRTPLDPIIERINTDSQNMYAEALMKRLGNALTGEPGSWSNGAAAVRMVIQSRLGPAHAAETRIADGSGYSRENRVHPDSLAAWLVDLGRDAEIGPRFMASLASAGEGTLGRRFRDGTLRGDVFAKSGTLNHVRCLSGYWTGGGRTVAFVCLVNDLERGSAERDARLFHEKVVEAIDAELAG
ncbi:MAG: D-alanyl-D-alanine carboxypeptidase/D-alanyl-D-alanine-endopeptidase [Planctomycetota bacterium]